MSRQGEQNQATGKKNIRVKIHHEALSEEFALTGNGETYATGNIFNQALLGQCTNLWVRFSGLCYAGGSD